MFDICGKTCIISSKLNLKQQPVCWGILSRTILRKMCIRDRSKETGRMFKKVYDGG